MTQAFDNPLRLVSRDRTWGTSFSTIVNGQVLLANLLEGARAGLLSALHSIFLFGAGIMAVSFALNLFLTLRERAKNLII